MEKIKGKKEKVTTMTRKTIKKINLFGLVLTGTMTRAK